MGEKGLKLGVMKDEEPSRTFSGVYTTAVSSMRLNKLPSYCNTTNTAVT